VLRRSVDEAKDQSYVLAVLTPGQLRHAIFPLGDSTKQQVRAEAARRGLAVADKPDSHDICFISDGDTHGFLQRKLGSAAGDIVDAESGAVVGTHDGSFGFTVGQRRGLRLDRPAPGGEPRYVLSIQPKDNRVMVGRGALLDVDEVTAASPVWTRQVPDRQFDCSVQLRAHGMRSAATVTITDDGVVARLEQSQRGVAAGQALVMYDDDRVIGSATIASSRPAAGVGASSRG
jgi:tRNA-specific 2-thiouridylase